VCLSVPFGARLFQLSLFCFLFGFDFLFVGFGKTSGINIVIVDNTSVVLLGGV